MKIFAVLLVSSVALCLAASDKKAGNEKNVQKRGLLGLHGPAAELQHGASLSPLFNDAASFFPSQQLISNTNAFVPSEPIHELAHQYPIATEARALPLAAPAYAHAYPAAAPAIAHGLPLTAAAPAYAQALPAPAFAHGLPLAHGYAHALPLAHETRALPLAGPAYAQAFQAPAFAHGLTLAHGHAHALPLATEARALPLAAQGYAHAYPAPAFANGLTLAHGHTHALPLATEAHAFPLAAPALAHSLPAPNFHNGFAYAGAYPLAHAVQTVPTQVNTVVKNVAVPFERQIPIDNPIYTPVERHIPIDNPVPVVKYLKQQIPVHIDEPVAVPFLKELRVPKPYIQKVPVVVQNVVKDIVAPQHTYLPPAY